MTPGPFGLLTVATLLTAWVSYARWRGVCGETLALLSVLFALVQLGVMWAANLATLDYAIGTVACLGGVFGFFGTLLVGGVDAIGVLALSVRKRMTWPCIKGFWVPRFLLHVVFGAGLAWSMLRCTV